MEVFFFLPPSGKSLNLEFFPGITESSPGDRSEFQRDGTGSGSDLGFGRFLDGISGILDGISGILGWKNSSWKNPGSRIDNSRNLEPIQRSGIPKILRNSDNSQPPFRTHPEPRDPWKTSGKAKERTSSSQKFQLLFQFPRKSWNSEPFPVKSAGIFPGYSPKKFPPLTLGFPPFFPKNPCSVLGIPGWERPKFRRRRERNLGKSQNPIGIPGIWDWNFESRTLALPPNLFSRFFFFVGVYFLRKRLRNSRKSGKFPGFWCFLVERTPG